MKLLGIIPARYQSSRFPGKPLADINGKSMIQRVYEQAKKAESLQNVVIATDDERILKHASDFGAEAVMTSDKHQNGTERCAEVCSVASGNFDGAINIQGDEPFIHPEQIDAVAGLLERGAEIATLVKQIDNSADYLSESVVKAVLNKNNEALYFSRAPVPFVKGGITAEAFKKNIFYKHIGIYGYKISVLHSIVKLASSRLEMLESLEQLRWLENGFKIRVGETAQESRAVDTPEDLELIKKVV